MHKRGCIGFKTHHFVIEIEDFILCPVRLQVEAITISVIGARKHDPIDVKTLIIIPNTALTILLEIELVGCQDVDGKTRKPINVVKRAGPDLGKELHIGFGQLESKLTLD